MSTHEFSPGEQAGEQAGEQSGQSGQSGQQRATTPPRRTGWHAVNTGHLVMGVAFVGLVVVWALWATDTVDITEDGWVMGLPWLVAGAAGLLATVLRGPRRHWTHEHWKHDHWTHGNHGSGSMHGWH